MDKIGYNESEAEVKTSKEDVHLKLSTAHLGMHISFLIMRVLTRAIVRRNATAS